MKNYKYEMVLMFIILVAIGTFYVMTIREGHDWGGDFSMYIHHAKNIAEGIKYNETGYIFNRYVPQIGPKAYPPVFPLMIAPVYKIFGLDLKAMKIELIIIFLLTLWIIWLIFRERLDVKYILAMVLIIGLSPFFWDFKDNVLSDIPFMFFVYLSLNLIDRRYAKFTFNDFSLGRGLIISFIIYLAYETRTIGIVLLGSIFVYEFVVYKRPSMFLLFTIISFLLMVLIQTIVAYNDSSYLFHLNLYMGMRLNDILLNGLEYLKDFNVLWQNGFSLGIAKLVFIIMTLMACIGYIRKTYLKVDIYAIFFVSYLILIIAYPGYQGPRYLIPIIPLYVFYSLKGIEWLDERINWRSCIFVIVTVIIGVSYTGKYRAEDFGPIRYGINKGESVELFKYIKENTDREDVIVFWKPRVLALYTDRKVSVYPKARDDAVLWNYFEEIGAKYYITGPYYSQEQQNAYYNNFIGKHKDKFGEIYKNSDFKVYRVK